MKYLKKSGFPKVLLTMVLTLSLSQASVFAYSMSWVATKPSATKIELKCKIPDGERSRPTIYAYANGKLIGSQTCASPFWGLNAVTTLKIPAQKSGTKISLKAVWVDKSKITNTYGKTLTSWHYTTVR